MTQDIKNNALVIDAADPLSLAIILPQPLADLVRALPKPLLIQDEKTLNTLVSPTEQQTRLKIQFWDEYENAVKNHRELMLGNIIFGVCTREYFLEFINKHRNVAWLIAPRPAYRLRVAELIERGLDCMQAIFEMHVTPKNQGTVRRLQMDALKMLDMRKHGGYTQRAEHKVLQRNIGVENTQNSSVPLGEGSVEELQAQVRVLEHKIEVGQNQNGSLLNHGRSDEDGDNPSNPIDVTPRTVS